MAGESGVIRVNRKLERLISEGGSTRGESLSEWHGCKSDVTAHSIFYIFFVEHSPTPSTFAASALLSKATHFGSPQMQPTVPSYSTRAARIRL